MLVVYALYIYWSIKKFFKNLKIMKNYFYIDGKKVPMSQETAESLREQFKENTELRITSLKNPGHSSIVEIDDSDYVLQIGQNCAPDKLSDRCLLVSQGYKAFLNNTTNEYYPQVITIKKDK